MILKKAIIAQSIAEAEYVAAASTTCQAKWLKKNFLRHWQKTK